MQITWDRWATPTITGEDDLDVTKGVGYATAVAHATHALELYGMARGKAAAYWGPAFLGEDTFTAQLGLDALTDTWVAAQSRETLARIEAFAEGFNQACSDDERRGTDRREALPITARDVLGHLARDFTRFNQIDARQLAFSPEDFYGVPGSNAWAVSATKSTTGNAMLVANPHLSWSLKYHRFFEFRTITPTRWVHGVTLLGAAWQSIGYNQDVAWTHTVNPIRNLTVYDINLSDDGSYVFDGERKQIETIEHKVEVLGEQPVMVLERRTVHGPIVTAPDGVDVAVRIAGALHSPATGCLESWWQMGSASTVEELVAIQDELPLPMFTLVAADSRGSIAAAFCGTPPPRTDWADTLRRVPGDDPAYLWTEVRAASEMPRVINPDSGWVQNCNDTPFNFTSPLLDPTAYPPAIAPAPWEVDDLRSLVSRAWMREHETVSPEQLHALKWSKRAVLADICLDALLDAAADVPELAQAVRILRDWDRQATADSKGYLLFFVWLALQIPAIQSRTLFAPYEPGELPTAIADLKAGVAMLQGAAAMLPALGVPLDASLGDFLNLGTADDPIRADGGSGLLGILKSLEVLPRGPQGLTMAVADTYVAHIELTPDGPKASNLLAYGNTTEPSAPQAESQTKLWAADQLRPSE